MAEYPLNWPPHWPRTKNPGKSQFKTSLSKALENVHEELRRFGDNAGKRVSAVVISSNVTLGKQNPSDPGVAVYFEWDGISTCIAVDRYDKVQDNLQAIAHCVEAERTKIRHGGLHLVRATFQGYAALPAPESKTSAHWSEVLCVSKDDSLASIESHYRMLAKKYHPDAPGGSEEKMSAINNAMAAARKEKGGENAA